MEHSSRSRRGDRPRLLNLGLGRRWYEGGVGVGNFKVGWEVAGCVCHDRRSASIKFGFSAPPELVILPFEIDVRRYIVYLL